MSSEDIANSIGLAEAKGAMVTKVTEDGPAAKEDLKAGDVIVEVNGEKIADSRDLARKIAELHPEHRRQALHRALRREASGRHEARHVPERARRLPRSKRTSLTRGEQMKDLGLSLAPATKFPGAGEEGVVITEVDPASDAAEKGLKPGDVILQVAGVTVSDPVRRRRRRQEGDGGRQDRQGQRSRC